MENASIHEELEPPRSVVDHPSRSNVKRVDRVEPKWDRLRKKVRGRIFRRGYVPGERHKEPKPERHKCPVLSPPHCMLQQQCGVVKNPKPDV